MFKCHIIYPHREGSLSSSSLHSHRLPEKIVWITPSGICLSCEWAKEIWKKKKKKILALYTSNGLPKHFKRIGFEVTVKTKFQSYITMKRCGWFCFVVNVFRLSKNYEKITIFPFHPFQCVNFCINGIYLKLFNNQNSSRI